MDMHRGAKNLSCRVHTSPAEVLSVHFHPRTEITGVCVGEGTVQGNELSPGGQVTAGIPNLAPVNEVASGNSLSTYELYKIKKESIWTGCFWDVRLQCMRDLYRCVFPLREMIRYSPFHCSLQLFIA